MRRLLLGGALLLVAPSATAGEVVRRALVVGANDGGVDLEPLRHAEDDAARISDILRELGGFEEGDVTLVTAADRASVVAALDAVAALPVQEGDQSLFLFYYSGHADTRGLRLKGEVLSYEELKAQVRDIPAEVHLGILDACRSGAISRVKGAAVADPFLDETTLAAEGEAWIAASSADEDAQESDHLEGSFFTHYLVSGLRGAADDGDGVVSLTEAYDYAHDRTVARTVGTTAGTQHPSYDYRLQGNGDLPLTDVRRATASVRLPEELAGVVTVLREPDRLPVAEVAKSSGRPVRMALPPGQYLLRLRDGGELRQVRLGLTEGSDLEVDRWGNAQGEVATAKGAMPVWIGEVPEGGVADAEQQGLHIETGRDEEGVVIRVAGNPFVGIERGLDNFSDAVGRRLNRRDEAPEDLPEAPETPATPDAPEAIPVTDSEAVLDRDMDRLRVPGLAAGVNVPLPGIGQMMQGRWGAGIAFMGGSYLLTAGGYVGAAFEHDRGLATGSPVGPNLGTFAGTALWMWSIADAAWADRAEFSRPRAGVTLSSETTWHRGQWSVPQSTGISADWVFAPGLSVGLDRVGFVYRPDGIGVFSAGVRGIAAIEAERLRPGVVLALANRNYWGVGSPIDDYVRPLFHVETQASYVNTWILGVGGQVRWYATPRYFVQGEVRWEVEPATRDNGLVAGAGVGLHLGER